MAFGLKLKAEQCPCATQLGPLPFGGREHTADRRLSQALLEGLKAWKALRVSSRVPSVRGALSDQLFGCFLPKLSSYLLPSGNSTLTSLETWARLPVGLSVPISKESLIQMQILCQLGYS